MGPDASRDRPVSTEALFRVCLDQGAEQQIEERHVEFERGLIGVDEVLGTLVFWGANPRAPIGG